MRTKLLILLATFLMIGCNVKMSRNKKSQEHIRLEKVTDSLRQDSVITSLNRMTYVLDSMRKESNQKKAHQSTSNTDIDYQRETSSKQHTIKGETFTTTIDANWVLDSAAIKRGSLVYFDMDNPTLKAKIYADSVSGKMKVEIQTKDKILDIPVDKVSFKSRQELKVDSTSDIHEQSTRNTLHISSTDSNVKQVGTSVYTETVDSSLISNIETDSDFRGKVLENWWIIGLIILIVLFLFANYRFCWIEKLCR